jgi:RNA polymerase sigma-70 factor, ECF subfamily
LSAGLHSLRLGDVFQVVRMTGDDREQLARIQSGSPPEAREALSALYGRHGGAVLRFLRGLLTDPNDADDVLQDTFLTAARRAEAFRGQDARPWLLAIAGNRARDARRRTGRRARRERAVSRPEGVSDQPAGPPIEGALADLGDRDRTLLELRYSQGLTHAEVAVVLGVSLRTAKGWAAQALDALRSKLEAQG